MDEVGQSPATQNAPEQKPDKYKTLFFILLTIVVVILAAGGFFYFSKRNLSVNPPSPTSSPAPTQQVVFPPDEIEMTPTQNMEEVKDEEVVPIGVNTVSFARVGNNNYLKYRGKIYDDSNQFERQVVQLQNPDQYTWYGLVDAPQGVVPNEFMSDEVFGFKVAPDTKSFAFVMRWGVNPQSSDYHLFYYTPFDKYRQSILIKI